MASDTRRWVLACVYALAVGLLTLSWARSPIAIPLMLVALGLPLAFRLVPRNYIYGHRTPRSLHSTPEVWYRQNAIAGWVMVAIGAVWLAGAAIRSALST